jgi:hypothetical protein
MHPLPIRAANHVKVKLENPRREAFEILNLLLCHPRMNAGVAAFAWAKQFYGAHEIYLRSVKLKQSGPVPYYLATFDGELAGARQVSSLLFWNP